MVYTTSPGQRGCTSHTCTIMFEPSSHYTSTLARTASWWFRSHLGTTDVHKSVCAWRTHYTLDFSRRSSAWAAPFSDWVLARCAAMVRLLCIRLHALDRRECAYRMYRRFDHADMQIVADSIIAIYGYTLRVLCGQHAVSVSIAQTGVYSMLLCFWSHERDAHPEHVRYDGALPLAQQQQQQGPCEAIAWPRVCVIGASPLRAPVRGQCKQQRMRTFHPGARLAYFCCWLCGSLWFSKPTTPLKVVTLERIERARLCITIFDHYVFAIQIFILSICIIWHFLV